MSCLPDPLAAIVQGPVVNPNNGHLYYLLSRNTWTASEAEAVRLGGHLATIRSVSEQNWIFRTFGQGFGGGRLLWIGLNDAEKESSFVWSGREASAYRFWAPGEPNNDLGREDYAALYYDGHSSAGRWNDWPNIQSDPIGIPFMGIVEIAPENFSIPLRDPILVDFDTFRSMSFHPQPVPADARLFTQIQASHGVAFSSLDGSVAVVSLGVGHATSGSNGIGGISGGSLNYSAPISISFTIPNHPEITATTDFISIRLDDLGGGTPVRMSAYGLDGTLLAQTTVTDVGGRVIAMTQPGTHRVVLQGNGNTAFDDLFFNGPTARPQLALETSIEGAALVWNAAFEDFVLESTDDLNDRSNWQPVEIPAEIVQNKLRVSVSHFGVRNFYRLRKQ